MPGSATVGVALADRLTFVLPVTLHEGKRLGDATAWRTAPDHGAELRVRFCIGSLLSRFDLCELHELLVICPADEVDAVARLVRSVTEDVRVRVLSELEVCPDVEFAVDPQTGAIRGWYVQQMLKLAIAEQVATPFYLTLDSDVVCVRPFSVATLVAGGRGVCGVETADTYAELYTPEFAVREMATKEARMVRSAELLGVTRATRYAGRSYSETPVLYHAGAMRDMCTHLTTLHARPWSRVLAETSGWTEMALYFVYLEATERLAGLYDEVSPNRILHLAGSVWHVGGHYRGSRSYDESHFRQVLADEDGLFVAVQSWLDIERWLPDTGHESLDEFYAHLGEVLGVDIGADSDEGAA